MKPVLLFTALLTLGLGAGACAATSSACDDNGNCNKSVGELQVNDARFEFTYPQPIARGRDFWMRAGNTVNVAWNSYTIFAAAPGFTCNSRTSITPPTCEKCDVLNPDPRLCPSGQGLERGVDLLRISTFAGFSRSSPENAIGIQDVAGVRRGVVTLQPDANVLAQITTTVGGLGVLAQAKLFVLQNGMSQQVTYPLTRLVTPDDSPDVVFYSGVLGRSPLLEDNFSADLNIEKLRVFQGTASVDPVTGKFAIKDPCLSAGCPKPSRIVFIPSYVAGSSVFNGYNYCYADQSLEAPPDGDLDKDRCPMFRVSTPAYIRGQEQSELMWVAEFRISEGAVQPALQSPDAALGIEFTIQ